MKKVIVLFIIILLSGYGCSSRQQSFQDLKQNNNLVNTFRDAKLLFQIDYPQKELQKMKEKTRWKEYGDVLQPWEDKWPELSPFFQYGPAVRKVMYTTNMIESVHGQFRKVTHTTKLFPHDEALKKLLWLAQRDISNRWNTATSGWASIMRQLAINFGDRMDL